MATALVVDDSHVDQLLAGHLLEQGLGVSVSYAADGHEALDLIASEPPSLILTDMIMPRINGLELVTQVRDKHPAVPVVLMTAYGSEELAAEALRRGAASYVPKRYLARDLQATARRVLELAQVQREQEAAVQCLDEASFRFVLDNDSARIHPLILYLREQVAKVHVCDETAQMRIAVALDEALCNAMHHGNLGVSSDLRQDGQEDYSLAVEERRQTQPWCERKVYMTATISHEKVVYQIQDEGEGFDPNSLPDPTDPTNLEKASGRGLLLIRTFMDEVRHNEKGNQITMVKRREHSPVECR